MCGIVGVAGRISIKEEQIFKHMLQLDTIRGPDSTGIAAINKDGQIKLVKSVGTPWDLMCYKEYNQIFAGFHACLIGHNRWATKGKVTDDNAHPFQFENVVGVHNGTITSGHRLDDYHKFAVDSEAFYSHVNKNGLADALAKAEGAFALCFYDVKEHELKLVRNTQRPLWYTFSKDQKTVFWASEPWMIAVACNKNDVEFEPIREVEAEKLYRFPIPKTHFSDFKGYNENFFMEPINFYNWKDYYTPANNGGHSDGKKEESSVVVKGNFPVKPKGFDIQEYNGTLVEFGVDKAHITGNTCYLEGWTDDARNIPVRIYAGVRTDLYKMLCEKNTYFSGKCTQIGYHNGADFLLINPSTVKRVVMDENGLDQKGKKCSAEHFYDITQGGCGCCGTFPRVDQARDIRWINNEDFICKDCEATTEGQMLIQYFSNSAVGG